MGSASYSAREVIETLGPLLLDARRARIAEVVAGRTCSVVPVMESLYDRGNVSAVLRSAEALGYQVVHNIDTSLKFKEAIRVTQGAEKWLDVNVWEDTETCLRRLKAQGYRILATHFDHARPLDDIDFSTPAAIVFGNEKDGISDTVLEAADERIVLPMVGFTQSFNISVAAALCLYHIQQDRIRRLGRHGDLSEEEQTCLTAEFYLRHCASAERVLARR